MCENLATIKMLNSRIRMYALWRRNMLNMAKPKGTGKAMLEVVESTWLRAKANAYLLVIVDLRIQRQGVQIRLGVF